MMIYTGMKDLPSISQKASFPDLSAPNIAKISTNKINNMKQKVFRTDNSGKLDESKVDELNSLLQEGWKVIFANPIQKDNGTNIGVEYVIQREQTLADIEEAFSKVKYVENDDFLKR